MKYSIVIPAYNEAAAILNQLNLIKKYLLVYKINAEIILVNDGSSDNTKKEIEKFEFKNIIVINNISNLGYGKSIKIGVQNSSNDNIVIIDCDMSYPFQSINQLIAEYESGYDLVIAERKNLSKLDGYLKHILRNTFKIIVNYISGNNVPDPNSGFRIFNKNIFLKHINIISDGFSMSTSSLLTFIFERCHIKFIPIELNNRVGNSKIKLSRDTLRMLQTVTQVCLYFNPLKIFVSMFLFFLFLLFITFGLELILNQNLIYLKVFFGFFGFQFLSLGFISEILRKK